MSARRVIVIAVFFLMYVLTACAAPTPTPTALPTRRSAPDAAHFALTALLSELEHDLTQARALMRYLAQAPPVRTGSLSECSEFVRQLLQTNPQYSQLGAASPNGVLFCNSNESRRTVSVADRLYFSRALGARDLVIGEYTVGRVTLVPSMGLAYPILDDSAHMQGVIIAPLKLGWLAERVANIDIPVTGEIVLLDTYGNLLLRDPDTQDWQGKNISATPLGKAMLTQIQGSGDFVGADGETRYYEFASPQGADDKLIAAVGIKK